MEISPKLRHRISVLRSIAPDAYKEVDGYYVAVLSGAYTSADLKVAAELLDEANRKWDGVVKKELEGLERAKEQQDISRIALIHTSQEAM